MHSLFTLVRQYAMRYISFIILFLQSDYKSIEATTQPITHVTKPEGVSTLDIDIPAAAHTRGESMLMTDSERRTCGNEQVVIQHENSMYTEELDGNVGESTQSNSTHCFV